METQCRKWKHSAVTKPDLLLCAGEPDVSVEADVAGQETNNNSNSSSSTTGDGAAAGRCNVEMCVVGLGVQRSHFVQHHV